MTLVCVAERLTSSSDMTGGLPEFSDPRASRAALYRRLEFELLEIGMDELIEFASLLMKLVILLAVVLMALSLMVVPDSLPLLGEAMLLLVVPLLVFTTLLDLAVGWRRSGAASRQPQRPRS
jgi:hypothetical protein